jgi:tyramine---L-glutamate ligase
MRLLVIEFITGGGLLGESLPDTLRREGEMMRDALLADLAEQADAEIVVMRDPRCAEWTGRRTVTWRTPLGTESPMEFYRRVLDEVDTVWPIAPETSGALIQLASVARTAGKRVLLSDSIALAICSSKFATYRELVRASIDSVETFRAIDALPNSEGPWIVKPDDGAGAAHVALKGNIDAALQALSADSQHSLVLQPWCEGEVLSLSMLCCRGRAALLSINRQHIFLQNGRVSVDGLTVNALPRNSTEFVALGQQIAAAMSQLWGYVGVDLIKSNVGALRVLEINPRLTTSYCGLRAALGVNVAGQVLRLAHNDELSNIDCDRDQPVELNLTMDYA